MNSISTLLEQLNPAQQEAVSIVEGPVLVVAGAGSGKTRVITYRIPYLLMKGAARPENILALTFTNKAAGEMKSRIVSLSGSAFNPPLISTFHSFGSVFLRRHISLLGYSSGFQVCDEEDQLALVKECLVELGRDSRYNPRDVQYLLKWQKSRSETAEISDPNVRAVLELYTKKLKAAQAVDFDDLLMLPLKIFREHPEVLHRYRNVYRFLMVDEYQDTNEIQYELLKALAGETANLLVVGDEDQSIYKFRGARAENIQVFLRDFPKARIVKLEQNYRSTKTIIKAAQAVISNNASRIKKELWTENTAGEPLEVYQAFDESDEANFVTLRVMGALRQFAPSEVAVLYRANAQSRVFEEAFVKAQIPHRIVGAVGFYQRREIKDVIAFLRLLVNRNDALSFERVANVPPRGAGEKMLEKVRALADQEKIPVVDAALHAGGRSLVEFASLYPSLPSSSASAFLEDLLKRIGYSDYLRKEDSLSADDRMENIAEFMSMLKEKESEPGFDLTVFLGELPLQSGKETAGDAVTLLTVHSAKGLEFRILFVVGLEDGLFPHIRSIENQDIEEERRLFYVAMTRARERLVLSWAQRRGMFGSSTSKGPSRFLEEIPGWFKVNKLSERFGIYPAPHPEGLGRNADDQPSEFRTGATVSHPKFGRGSIIKVEGAPGDWKLTIRFREGTKTILTKYVQLTRV